MRDWMRSMAHRSRAAAAPVLVTVTRRAPHLRDAMNLAALRRIMLVALAPCLIVAVYNTGHQAALGLARAGLDSLPGWRGELLAALGLGGWAVPRGLVHVVPIFGVTLVTGTFWRLVFARLRQRPFAGIPLVTALIFTMILPPGAPLWQVALGMSFGLVIGKDIFGGTGKNFMNPALVGLAFLYLSYPNDPAAGPVWAGGAGYGGTMVFSQVAAGGMDALSRAGLGWWDSFIGIEPGPIGVSSAAGCLVGAVVLIASGAASWRIMAGAVLGAVAAVLVAGVLGRDAGSIFALPWYWHLTLGSFAFGTVFVATDPVTAASTNPGRWIYGLLIGVMIVLVRIGNPAHTYGVMMAILLGNIFAPLIDHGVIRANIRRRARRGG